MSEPINTRPFTDAEKDRIIELAITACRAWTQESAGDFVYNIRERELEGWEGERVLAWAAADKAVREVMKLIGEGT